MARQFQAVGAYINEQGARQFQSATTQYFNVSSAGSVGGQFKASVGVGVANVKTVQSLAIAGVKTYDALTV